MKVIDSIWFNSRAGHCGFVIGEDEATGEFKLYAGVVSGLNQNYDEQEILDWGNKISIEKLDKFLAILRGKKK